MSLSEKPLSSVSVTKGAILVVAMRWTDRIIGIVSVLILARLLLPGDFGIVAMASLVIGLIETLLDFGVSAALVQNREADRHDFDTAWTLRLMQSTLAAAVIVLFGASLAADYFNDPRVVDVLHVMAATVFLSGFENIGIVLFQKNMEFGRDFRFFFLRRIAGFIITIALALWLQTYWAMVLGTLFGRIVGVALSYWLHDYRPRFSLERFSHLWSFSQWILIRNLGSYGAMQTDKLLVGRRSDANTLGAYSLADEISAIPTREILMPLGRVLFPAFVNVADRPEELRRVFCLALGVQALIALPAGVGLALVADTAVPLLLGSQWYVAIPLVQWLALMNVMIALMHSCNYLLLALGEVRLQAILSWIQFALLLTLTLFVFPSSGAEIIAEIRLIVSLIAMVLLLALVLQAVPILQFRDLFIHTWRSLVACCLMAGVLFMLHLPSDWPLVWQLAVDVCIGSITYATSILLLWWVTGKQTGGESYLLKVLQIKQRVKKLIQHF